MSDPSDLTLVELRARCKNLGLASSGTKAELIARLTDADPSLARMAEEEERDGDRSVAVAGIVAPQSVPDYENLNSFEERENLRSASSSWLDARSQCCANNSVEVLLTSERR